MKQLLIIGHDANRAGAQLVLLNLMRLLKAEGITMRLLLGGDGPLLDAYQAICPVVIWPSPKPNVVENVANKVLSRAGIKVGNQQAKAIQREVEAQLALNTTDLILVNTAAGSHWFSQLAIPKNIPVVTFVHELGMSVRMYTKPNELAYLLQRTTHLLAVSRATARYYEQQHGFDPARITLFTLINTPLFERRINDAKQQPNIYESLGLPPNALIVGSCGNAEWRKGNDLFVTLARQVIGREAQNSDQPIHFVWVGVPEGNLRNNLLLDIEKAGLSNQVHLILPTPGVMRYMVHYDVFVLTSREDPYPLVVFEAGLSDVPVVCFDNAGGAPELIESDGGFVVPYLDLDAMSSQVITLLHQPDLRKKMGQRLGQKIKERHPAQQSIETLVTLFNELTNVK